MPNLEVIYTLELVYALFVEGSVPTAPITIEFPKTANAVQVDAPVSGFPDSQWGESSKLVLHVRRECSQKEADDALSTRNHDQLHIPQDAARALFLLFEMVREIEFEDNRVLHGYPVVLTDAIQRNPLVKRCDAEVVCEGRTSGRVSQTSLPYILIRDDTWQKALERIKSRHSVPVYISFALDACYFAQADPVRGIIMASSAWETALRFYLANVASKLSPAYGVAAQGGNIPRLLEFVKTAKGTDLLEDWIQQSSGTTREAFMNCRRIVYELATIRNKLVHQGEKPAAYAAAQQSAHAVLTAIDWLFEP